VADKVLSQSPDVERNAVAIRHKYEEHGVADYYEQFGPEYRNPHEDIIKEVLLEAVKRWQLEKTSVLDLACGSGEVTIALREQGWDQIAGVDPYTSEAYLARTGLQAEAISFEQIAAGRLAERRYGLIVCSFAMHLIDESWLPALLAQLGLISDCLLIITPHKRPEIKAEWGWHLQDEFVIQRVRGRIYRSKT